MRRIAFALVLGVAMLVAPDAHATGQIPDRIVLGGRIHSLMVNPLEDWLDAHPAARPSQLPGQKSPGWCSGNWRGYLATFTVADGLLMLDRVVLDACTQGDPDTRTDLVPLMFEGREAVPVEWFTGLLVVPTGELVKSVHMGYGSLYSNYRLFRVERGRVLDEARMDGARYERYRKAQFRAWQQTDDYRRELDELLRPTSGPSHWAPGEAEEFLYALDVGYTARFALPFSAADAAE